MNEAERRRTWRGGFLLAAGVLLIAAFAGVWFFRESLFRAACLHNAPRAMSLLLRLDRTIASRGARKPPRWGSYSFSPSGSALNELSPLAYCCLSGSVEQIAVILGQAELGDDPRADGIALMLQLGRESDLETLSPLLDPELWRSAATHPGYQWDAGQEAFLRRQAETVP